MGHVFRTETQQMAVDSLRRYLDAEVEPFFNGEHRDQFVPKEKMLGFMQGLSQFGLINGPIGEENGGMGLDTPTLVMLIEEVSYTSLDLSASMILNMAGAKQLERLAPPHLRDRYLPRLLKGEIFSSTALSEPGVGSNVLEIRTHARRDGDDFVINGEKTWITNGGYSDFLICTCRTGEEAGHLTYFLLDRKENPYEVREIKKVGFTMHSTAQIFLSDVRVPAENMIGTFGGAFKNALTGLETGRIYVAMQAVGLARRALDEAVKYACERSQHGKVIAKHQLVSAMLANMAVRIDAARLLVLRAAEMSAAGMRAEMEASMAKYFATEMAVEVTRQAVQIHGGNGITKDFLVEKLARDSLLPPIYEGTSQIQQLIVGRALTGVRSF